MRTGAGPVANEVYAQERTPGHRIGWGSSLLLGWEILPFFELVDSCLKRRHAASQDGFIGFNFKDAFVVASDKIVEGFEQPRSARRGLLLSIGARARPGRLSWLERWSRCLPGASFHIVPARIQPGECSLRGSACASRTYRRRGPFLDGSLSCRSTRALSSRWNIFEGFTRRRFEGRQRSTILVRTVGLEPTRPLRASGF